MICVEIGLDGQTHRLRDMGFHARINLRERADRSGNGTCRDVLARRNEPFARTGKFRIGVSELEAKGGRLGVNAVRTTDGRRELVFKRSTFQRREQVIDIGDQEVGGAHQLHIEAGIEHIR